MIQTGTGNSRSATALAQKKVKVRDQRFPTRSVSSTGHRVFPRPAPSHAGGALPSGGIAGVATARALDCDSLQAQCSSPNEIVGLYLRAVLRFSLLFASLSITTACSCLDIKTRTRDQ